MDLGARPAAAIASRRLRESGQRGLRRGPRAQTLANPLGLTGRQMEVLELLAQGMRNAEIAERLFLSPLTIKTHVARILDKLNLRDRIQAVVLAYETGIVHPGSKQPRLP